MGDFGAEFMERTEYWKILQTTSNLYAHFFCFSAGSSVCSKKRSEPCDWWSQMAFQLIRWIYTGSNRVKCTVALFIASLPPCSFHFFFFHVAPLWFRIFLEFGVVVDLGSRVKTCVARGDRIKPNEKRETPWPRKYCTPPYTHPYITFILRNNVKPFGNLLHSH